MLSAFSKQREFVSCVIKDIYLVRNLEHLRRIRFMFAKKNSKRAREKKKRKEKKKKKNVFFFCFLHLQAKKKIVSFTQNTQTLNQIPHHHSFVARKTHTYIFIIII